MGERERRRKPRIWDGIWKRKTNADKRMRDKEEERKRISLSFSSAHKNIRDFQIQSHDRRFQFTPILIS